MGVHIVQCECSLSLFRRSVLVTNACLIDLLDLQLDVVLPYPFRKPPCSFEAFGCKTVKVFVDGFGPVLVLTHSCFGSRLGLIARH